MKIEREAVPGSGILDLTALTLTVYLMKIDSAENQLAPSAHQSNPLPP